MATFSKRLRDLRKSNDITLDELAEKLGSTKSTLSRYENDWREPKIEFAQNAASFFNVSVDYLLGKTDDPTTRIMDKEELPRELIDIGIEYLEVFKDAKSSDITPEDIKEIITIIKRGRSK